MRQKKRIFHNQDGFSLLEVTITLGILSTIIFAISSLMRNTFDVKVALSQKNRVTIRSNRALEQLTYDISHAFLLDSKRAADRTGGARRTEFKIKETGSSDRLSMTYMGHRPLKANSPESDLSHVVYELRKNQEFPHRTDLYRGELKRIPSKDYRFKEDPPMKVFVRNISSIEFLPWQGDDWSKSGWDSSRSDTDNLLPHLIQIRISAWTYDPVAGIDPNESEEQDLLFSSTSVHLPYALDFKELKQKNSSFGWKL